MITTDRYNELLEELETKRARVLELANRDGELEGDDADEFRALTSDDEGSVTSIAAMLAKADEDRAKVAKIEALRFEGRVSETPGGPDVIVKRDRNIWDLDEARVRSDGPKGYETEIRARAEEAIETAPKHLLDDNARESATQVLHRVWGRNGKRDVAEHIIRTGSPAYHEAFEEYIQNPTESRAALSLTGANGGFLVPFTLDPTIILTNTGAQNPFRQISRVVSITTDDWNGVSSAGVTGEWLAEGSEAADASPTFAQPSITAHKAAAYVFASYEVLADSGVGSELGMLFADAKDRLEATAHATGTGSGQPYGIVTALQLTTASRIAGSSGAAGAADLVAADIYALDNDLGPRYRGNNPVWVGHHSTWNVVRQFATANNYHAYWTDFGGGRPSQLLGYSVYNSSAMDSTRVSGSNDDVIVLGDFSNYVIVDRVGMSVLYEPIVKGSNQRPTGQGGWFAFWRVGGDSVNDDAFRMLRI